MTETLRTSCTRDCPDACGLIATVEDGRVTRLSGDPEHPVTQGFLCYRVGTHFLDRHYSPERLTTPLLRRDGELQPISWDDALDHAASELTRIIDESGAPAILHCQGGGSLGILKGLHNLFFRSLGGDSGAGATETRGEVCDGAGSWANVMDFGAADANEPADLDNAHAVILWGKNPTASSPHTTPFLKRVRDRGGELWLIDPLPHRTQKLVDHYVQPRPGGDAALAFGIGRRVIELGGADPELDAYAENVEEYRRLCESKSVEEWAAEADVEPAMIDRLARVYVERAPVTTLIGWGLQRRANGATQVRAISALSALTGNVGRPGAGASFTTPRRRPFDLSVVETVAHRVPRTLRLPLLGEDILAAEGPPIRAVVIDNHNPVATNPDSETTRRALESREFVLVIDSFLTDTARCADLVLPTTTMLEETDLVGSYGHHFISAVRPVVERLDGTRTDLEIYQALAERLGFGEALAGTAEDWCARALVGASTRDPSIDHAALVASAARAPESTRVAFEGRRFPTESGRFRFVTEHRPAPPADPDYPLHLQGLSTGRWQASQLTEQDEEREGPLTVTLHPNAAAGLQDGDEAILESRIGALPVVVRTDPAYRRDTVYVPRARSVARRLCVNLLIRARLTDYGEGAAFYDEGVRIRIP